MKKKMIVYFVFFAFFCVVIYFLFLDSDGDIKSRTRYTFKIAKIERITPETIKAAILMELPLESDIDSVIYFLDKKGFFLKKQKDYFNRDDGFYQCIFWDKNIFCNIFYDPKKMNLKLRRLLSYQITFMFDEQKKLKEVKVEEDWVAL